MSFSLASTKLLLGLTDTSQDAVLTELDALFSPLILSAASGVSAAALELAASEIVAGEFLARRIRGVGALDDEVVSGVVARKFRGQSVLDPYELSARGWSRLGKGSSSRVSVGGERPGLIEPSRLNSSEI